MCTVASPVSSRRRAARSVWSGSVIHQHFHALIVTKAYTTIHRSQSGRCIEGLFFNFQNGQVGKAGTGETRQETEKVAHRRLTSSQQSASLSFEPERLS